MTRRWPLVTGAVNHLKVRSCVIDGEVVCCAAQYKFGLRPIELAGWRHYSAIGLGEMAQEPRANQKKIEAEYKGATARYAAAIRAAAEWDRKAGIAPLRAKFKRACEAEKRASNRMIRTPVTTPAGAAALIEHVRMDMELGDASWHKVALANVAKALASVSRWRA